MPFSYLADKIRTAGFNDEPFRHIQINDFLSESHFSQLISAPEIDLAPAASTEQLFEALFASGYKIINFPGCITNKDEYLHWHKTKAVDTSKTNTSCEGFGITLRLASPQTPILRDLLAYFKSGELLDTLADKFGIARHKVYSDNGIQKYLDGYEISPHPDIRKKALTYMVNLNPGLGSEQRDHHTQYLRFRDKYKYVQAFWEGNPEKDRCWVPWGWCETTKIQRENNSIVLFAPGDRTLHGVKANYNHLAHQRTQLYGNFWYHEGKAEPAPEWENFIIQKRYRLPYPPIAL